MTRLLIVFLSDVTHRPKAIRAPSALIVAETPYSISAPRNCLGIRDLQNAPAYT